MHAIKELKKEVRKIQNYKKSINPQCGCFSRRRRFVIGSRNLGWSSWDLLFEVFHRKSDEKIYLGKGLRAIKMIKD
jgi:hypothetical protein